MGDCREAHEDAGGNRHNHDDCEGCEECGGHSLFGFIDTTRVRCLNESTPGSVLRCIKPWTRRRELEPCLESNDDDPQLIIHVPFTQVVKIKAINVVGGRGGTAPAILRVWVNRDDVDFSNAEDLPPLQTIELANSDAVAASGAADSAMDYPTKVNKTQNVSSIALFVPENYGADQTCISFLGFKGETTNV
ncbi:unnamed protein product, partial [Phaeothamnion confervicola]